MYYRKNLSSLIGCLVQSSILTSGKHNKVSQTIKIVLPIRILANQLINFHMQKSKINEHQIYLKYQTHRT